MCLVLLHEMNNEDGILQWIEIFQGIFVVISNSFVLGLFYQEGTRGRYSNLHIISLAISDILQGLINAPAVVYLTYFNLRVSDPECFWIMWIACTSAFTQIFIIMMMTVDRFWAVVYAIQYRMHATRHLTLGNSFNLCKYL